MRDENSTSQTADPAAAGSEEAGRKESSRELASSQPTLERILQLAQEVRIAHSSPQWKTAPDAASERHGEACDALWDELFRLLDERAGTIERLKPPPDERKLLRRAIVARLKAELPGIVTTLVDEVCEELHHA